MTKRSDITPHVIALLISYDPETGEFVKLPRTLEFCKDIRSMNSFNKLWAGKKAGTRNYEGRTQINILGHLFYGNRVAYAIMTGEWPEHEVDHINNNKSDDRWVNLRAATRNQNQVNVPMKPSNMVGFKGVKKTPAGRFSALIRFEKKYHYLGTFNTPEEAHAAYCEAAARLHGEFARLK